MNQKRNYPTATVGGLIIAPDNSVLLVRSKKWKDHYSLPGGKIEIGERCIDAFRREVKEETGLTVENIRPAFVQESIFSTEFHEPCHFIMNDFVGYLPYAETKESVVLNEEAYDYLWVLPADALKLDLQKECRTLIEWHIQNQPKYGIIGVEGYCIDCIVGIHPAERLSKQHLFVDMEFKIDLSRCFETGHIDSTLDYTQLACLAKTLALEKEYLLIETFAKDLLTLCFQRFPVVWGKVCIRKPAAIPAAQNAYITLEFGEL